MQLDCFCILQSRPTIVFSQSSFSFTKMCCASFRLAASDRTVKHIVFWYVACTLNFSKDIPTLCVFSLWCLITVWTGKSWCCKQTRYHLQRRRRAGQGADPLKLADRDKGIKWWLISDLNHKWQAESIFRHNRCQTHLSQRDTVTQGTILLT